MKTTTQFDNRWPGAFLIRVAVAVALIGAVGLAGSLRAEEAKDNKKPAKAPESRKVAPAKTGAKMETCCAPDEEKTQITGSHLPQTVDKNVRTPKTAAPVDVINRDRINQSGARTLHDLLSQQSYVH